MFFCPMQSMSGGAKRSFAPDTVSKVSIRSTTKFVRLLEGERRDRLIYRANEAMIRRADFGICNLTPFRGPGADAGTVFELGMLAGLGKKIFGYTNIVDDLLERSKLIDTLTLDRTDNEWRDSSRMIVENFGNADNLMIDNALLEHGGHAMVRHRAGADDVFYDLTGFETCLRLAAEAAAD